MEILRTLGRRLGYLDREMQIKQIELLETDVEEPKKTAQRKNAGAEENLPVLRDYGRHFACSIVLVRGEGGECGSHHYFQNSGGRDSGFHSLSGIETQRER